MLHHADSLYHAIDHCRSCGSTRLEPVLDLGTLAISDFLTPSSASTPGHVDDHAPLELLCCQDCTLVQLRHTVDRERLYRDYYYHSGTNESMVEALQDVAFHSVQLSNDGSNRVPKSVLDIGANDGTLLKLFPSSWMRHGFEPSSLAACAPKGTHILHDFFPSSKVLVHGKYDVITSIACFYDVDDPNAFVSTIKDWLHKDGIWVCQFQDFHSMVVMNAFDNICHEHLTYWTQDAFLYLLGRHGLEVASQSNNRVNGGSVRYIIRHRTNTTYTKPEPYRLSDFRHQMRTFAHNARMLKAKTMRLLDNLMVSKKLVLGYGASTKGNTLLQYFGIGPDQVPYIADRNPEKWGKHTSGTHIPIISEESMRAQCPDYLLVLPWHFIDNFMSRETKLLQQGTKFIVPLPEFSIMGIEPEQATIPYKLAPGGASCPSTHAAL